MPDETATTEAATEAPAAPAAAPAAPAPSTALGVSADPWSDLDEKFVVKKEDGSLDQAAVLSKYRDSYRNLEKRMGSGEARPYRAVDYKLNVPEEMKAMADAPEIAAFRKKAHEAGFSQKQFDLAVGQYLEIAPSLVGGAKALDAESTVGQLKTEWGADFDANINAARRAARTFGADIGPELDAELGNHPVFLKFLAKVGAELQEDRPPSAAVGASAEDVNALMASEAYLNAAHKDHASVSRKVQAHFSKQPGEVLG
jgi:hypothetical protein